ncbi:calcium-binding protein [Streptomyces sp. NPDC058694]|uniref:calcium-binding protein n=1 Tax=Streptomyces sp. NPDC058694 TaxID=3346603 RepID=UPI0036665040
MSTVRIFVNAVEGKANDLSITRSLDTVTISDGGDTVTAGAGCTQVDVDTVRCPYGGRTLTLEGGNLGDIITVTGSVPAIINGGAGNDIITLDPNATAGTTLDGQAGHDSIFGGGGADRITGGTGDDVMFGRNGNDRLDALDSSQANDRSFGDAGTDTCVGDLNDLKDSCES